MAAVRLIEVTISFGPRTLLDSINFAVGRGQRIALTGANGSGKSTLMKIMAEQIKPDSGQVVKDKQLRISYLPQSGVLYGRDNLYKEMEKAFDPIKWLISEKEKIEQQLAEFTEESSELKGLLENHHVLQQQIMESDYYMREKSIDMVLRGLGFKSEDFSKECSTFSAGWQMRIALAKVLLEKPDILLLDEPTNYLDLEARLWLENFLANFKGGILLVSHDRYFLDITVNEVAEIYMGKLNKYKGNYSAYEKQRGEELESIIEKYRVQQEEIEKTEAFIRRFRYQASKAALVQSRIKYLNKMERIEIPFALNKIHFNFPPAPHSGKTAVRLENIAKSFNHIHLFKDLNLELTRGVRLVLVGPNGAGKSTLIKIMAGREPVDNGLISYGKGINIGYFCQEKEETLNNSLNIIQELEAIAPTDIFPKLRNMLGTFLFQGDDIYKSISILSGGERNRLALLKILLHPPNLLLLDEPTNHLDMAAKDVLLDALKQYTGTLVFVSHDHYFIQALATKVLELGRARTRLYHGNYEYYLWKKEQELKDKNSISRPLKIKSTNVKKAASKIRERSKARKSHLNRLEKQIATFIIQIEELEKEKKALEETMALPEIYKDGEKMRELKEKLKTNTHTQKQITSRWVRTETELSILQKKVDRE